MSAKLQVIAGPNQGQAFNLVDRSSTAIGRGDTATFRLADPTVSRAHCSVEWADGKAILRDSGSKTGTKVNGKAITGDHKLQPGEVISIGTTQMRFEREAPPPPAPTMKVNEEAGSPDELCALSVPGWATTRSATWWRWA